MKRVYKSQLVAAVTQLYTVSLRGERSYWGEWSKSDPVLHIRDLIATTDCATFC